MSSGFNPFLAYLFRAELMSLPIEHFSSYYQTSLLTRLGYAPSDTLMPSFLIYLFLLLK